MLVLVARVRAKRRGFDDLLVEEHVSESKPAADDPRVAKRRFDFVRRRAGRDIEILRLAPDEQVAHTSADEVGFVAGPRQLANHAVGIGVDGGAIQRRHNQIEPYHAEIVDRKCAKRLDLTAATRSMTAVSYTHLTLPT